MRKLEYTVGDIVTVTRPNKEIFKTLWYNHSDDMMYWFGIGQDEAVRYLGNSYVVTSTSTGRIEDFEYKSYELGPISGIREERDNWYYWPAWMLRLSKAQEPEWEV